MTHQQAVQRWNDVEEYLHKYYVNPDKFPLRVVLAQYAVHWLTYQPPVWSFVLGTSSSGKTEIVLAALKELDSVVQMDIINKNSFLSGFGKEYGALPQLPDLPALAKGDDKFRSGIITFPDFSTFLELHKEERGEIQSQWRRLFDGNLSRNVGNTLQGERPEWRGKVTLIAACTLELEDYWNLARNLGERFLYCRMSERTNVEHQEIAYRSLAQISNGFGPAKEVYQTLIKRFVDINAMNPEGSALVGWETSGLPELSNLIARARIQVKREGYGINKHVTDVGDVEAPARVTKELGCLAIGNAMLMRRPETTNADFRLALMVGRNTVPRVRLRILQALVNMKEYGYTMQQEYLRSGHRSGHSFNLALEDLEAIGLIQCYGDPRMVQLTAEAIELCERAKVGEGL